MVNLPKPDQPHKSRIEGAAPSNLTRRTNPPAVGVNPKPDQQSGAPGRSACRSFHRLDRPIEPIQIQFADKAPNRSRGMVLFDEPLHVQHLPGQLGTVHRLDPSSYPPPPVTCRPCTSPPPQPPQNRI